jgi:proline dehydrogenase
MPALRSAFIALSRNRTLRNFCESTKFGRRMSSRFVAGMEIGDALRVASELNHQGFLVTLDSLGESISSDTEAHRAAEIYHELLKWIAAQKLNANISVKLTQMGLELDPALAERIALSLTRRAAEVGSFVPIGVVIQSYLYRSQADVEQLLLNGIRVRLCKGAYKEPPEVAFPKKSDVDANYIRLTKLLLDSPIYHGIATHDEAMIAAAQAFASERGIDKSRFEFQMLFGVRRDLQRRLVSQGYNVRVYVPFGTEWYPYFMRRLAERPANVIFLAKNYFRS